jgi:Zn-dependent protease
LAASSSSNSRYCAKCGTLLDPGLLACSNCGRFTYAEQLQELSTRARQFTATGQLQAAKETWQTALNSLPPASNERQAVLREIAKLDARLNPQPKTDWRKRLGPLGVAIAFLAKFKTALLLLPKAGFLFSLVSFLAVYWALYGWWYGLGITLSILMHEFGHYFVIRRFGFAADLPRFRLFGAYVRWSGQNVDPGITGQISLAGPLFGFISGLIAYVVFLETGYGVWLGVAQFAGWLNLLNLIPIWIFDGSTAMNAVGKQERIGIVAASIALFAILGNVLFLGVAGGAAYRLWRRDFPAQSVQFIAYYYTALVAANGFLSWFCVNEMHKLFPGPR